MVLNLWAAALIVLGLNLLFGYWRANVRRFSLQWFLSIHIPVPLVIILRVLGGLGWQLITFPVLVGAFFLGHLLGGRLYRWREKQGQMPLTSCLLCDLVRRP